MNKCIIMICITIVLMWQLIRSLVISNIVVLSRSNPAKFEGQGLKKESHFLTKRCFQYQHRVTTHKNPRHLDSRSHSLHIGCTGCLWKITLIFINNLSELLSLSLTRDRLLWDQSSLTMRFFISRFTLAAVTATTPWSSYSPRNTTWRTSGPSTGWTGSLPVSSCLAGMYC